MVPMGIKGVYIPLDGAQKEADLCKNCSRLLLKHYDMVEISETSYTFKTTTSPTILKINFLLASLMSLMIAGMQTIRMLS